MSDLILLVIVRIFLEKYSIYIKFTLSRTNEIDVHVFPQVTKNIEVLREKIWAVWRMLKCLPVKSLLHSLAVWNQT